MRSSSRTGKAVTALAVGAFVAAPPLGWALSATTFKTSLTRQVDVNHDRIRLKTKDPADVHVQEARFAPGDVVNWHDHPGFALIAVKSGTMTFYDADCNAHVVGAGQSIVESGGPTRTVNAGSEEAVIAVTYVVPEGAARTVPTGAPACADGG